MAQTIRFSELVKKSGQPHSATLWTDPEQDAEFKKAIKQNRVLTVKQETVGSKRDFGTIGFRKDKNVSYLVFPKALPKEDKHVVGIKYDLLDQPKTKDPVSTSAPKKKAAPSPPKEKEFTAILRQTAVWEIPLRVEARDKTEAKKKFDSIISEQKFSESEAVVRHDLRDLRG